MTIEVHILPKAELADPAGEAIKNALLTMGFSEIKNVRVGKLIKIEMDSSGKREGKKKVKQMCEKLLVNSIIEDYKIQFLQ